jgi:SET domain-containing protein
MASTLPPPLPPRTLIARDSAIHGRGVYATRAIPAGATLIEYTGERITHAEARRRERLRQKAARLDPASDAACDYLFIADDHTVIDGRHETSPARLINHACETNCDIEIEDGRIFLVALTAIARGAELTFDYGYTWREGLAHPCRCGRPACVGFIISAGQRWRLRSGRAITPTRR